MKKILITGGFGLLGINLVNFLLKKKYKIIILDYKKTNSKKKFFIKSKNLVFENANFVNMDNLNKIFNKHSFSAVFHLGAQTQVKTAYNNPYETLQTNVMGTTNILEILRKKNIDIPIVYSSSDKAYGELKRKYYYENDNLNAVFPYDVSKSASDLICQSYSKTYNMKIGIIRSANIFGECDFNLKRIVPETTISILKNRKLEIRSSGRQRRDYIYVLDVCRAYYQVYKHLLKSKKNLLIYNTGSKYNLSALELIEKIYNILKVKKNYIIKNSSKAEINNQRLGYKKIVKEIGWKPICTLDYGLKKTIDWYKKNINLF
jgi:CDP-glucose 4,6-dehydratase|tara:strand:+ start:4167 stop:5120 length:954 start_codon:yes stop_codon:yes gene_type:complete